MKPILLIDGATGTGDGVAVVFDRYTSSMVVFDVTGVNGDTIRWLARAYDGGDQFTILALNLNDGVEHIDATANGLYRIDASGLFEIVPTVSSYGSGTIFVRAVYRRG
jgi:hypothetical protein